MSLANPRWLRYTLSFLIPFDSHSHAVNRFGDIDSLQNSFVYMEWLKKSICNLMYYFLFLDIGLMTYRLIDVVVVVCTLQPFLTRL